MSEIFFVEPKSYSVQDQKIVVPGTVRYWYGKVDLGPLPTVLLELIRILLNVRTGTYIRIFSGYFMTHT